MSRTHRHRRLQKKLQRSTLRCFESLEPRRLLAAVNLAQSTIDVDLFAQHVEVAMGDSVFGYGYSVSTGEPGTAAYDFVSGSDGVARIEADGELPFMPDTRMETASVSKPITATAVLKLLQDQAMTAIEIDPDVDPMAYADALRTALNDETDGLLYQPAINFFPQVWQDEAGLGVANITIRDLLRHTSGYESYALTYEDLEELIINGIENPIDQFFEFDTYTTTNYSLLRVMVPYLWDAVDNDILDGTKPTSDLSGKMQDVLMNDWGTIEVNSSQLTSSLFAYYVQSHVLEPGGVQNVGMRNTGPDGAMDTGDETLVYTYFGESHDTGDQLEKSGGRGANMSSEDLEGFLTGFRYNTDILHPATRQLMEDDRLGLQSTSGDYGTYLGHNGANMRGYGDYMSYPWNPWNEVDDVPTSVSSHKVNTRVTLFPNVVASLVINSQFVGGPWENANIKEENKKINNTGWMADVLTNAYENSLTGLVVDGDPNQADYFIVRHPDWTDVLLEVLVGADAETATPILTRPVATLQSLTLNGLGEGDTFDIQALPASVNLTILGEEGDDTILLGGPGTFSDDIRGNVTIAAGPGGDTLSIDDSAGVADSYTITPNTFSSSLTTQPILFSGVEAINFTANDLDNAIDVAGTSDGMELVIDGRGSDDTITLNDLLTNTNVTVYTGFGDDTVTVATAELLSQVTMHAPAEGPAGENTFILGAGNLGEMLANVVIFGGPSKDSLIVNDQDALSGQTFTFWHANDSEFISRSLHPFSDIEYYDVEHALMQAGDHPDTFDVKSLSGTETPSGRVLRTDLEIWGGGADDEFLIAEVFKSVSQIKGTVSVYGEDGTGVRNPNELPPMLDNDTLEIYDLNQPDDSHFVVGSNGILGTIEKPLFSLEYAGIENSHLYAGYGDNEFDIESTPLVSGPLTVWARHGQDTMRITPTWKNQGLLNSEVHFHGGSKVDSLYVYDQGSGYAGTYELSKKQLSREGAADVHFARIERLDWHLNDQDNVIDVLAPKLKNVTVFGLGGDDTLTARSLKSHFVFRGGDDDDHAALTGSRKSDEIIVEGNRVELGKGVLEVFDVESRALNGHVGRDHLVLQGINTVNESFHIQPLMSQYSGRIDMFPHTPLEYENIESVEVLGNDNNADTLSFDGAFNPLGNQNVQDIFSLHLTAAGTFADPLLDLRAQNGTSRLKLTNYSGIDVLQLDGMNGPDQFHVQVANNPAAAGRAVSLVAGLGNDTLSVEYADVLDLAWNEYGDGSGDMSLTPLDEEIDQLFQIFYHEMESASAAEF